MSALGARFSRAEGNKPWSTSDQNKAKHHKKPNRGGGDYMKVTFAPSSNTSTNGVALSSNAEDDVRVYKLIVGAPVSAGNIWLYTINNPVSSATTNIASKITLPTF